MNFDPKQIAQKKATEMVQRARQLHAEQSRTAKSQAEGLNQLQKLLEEFRSSMNTLSGKKHMLAMAASFSQDGVGTVSVKGNAQPGSYSLFVEQLAVAHQLVFDSSLPIAANSGHFIVKLNDGDTFNVDLASADKDSNSSLTAAELALAINQAPNNTGKVNAMVLTVEGKTHVMLSSVNTGKNGEISLDASGVTDEKLQAGLSAPKELARAKDAIVWLGEKGVGMRMIQSSNTFNVIDGVSMVLNREMKPDDALLQLKVVRNESDSVANVQTFVDAFNTLNKAIDSMLVPAQKEKAKAGGAFASDASIRGLREQLSSIVRQEFEGMRLIDLGITTSRDRILTLDRKKFDKCLSDKPATLEALFLPKSGKGIIKESTEYIEKWVNSINGLIKLRKDSQKQVQDALDVRKSQIDSRYDQAYERYLKQYRQMQATQAQMGGTLEMLNNYFN